eukprot:scaffold39184_cov23-Tisochrysis_lutea.AAC.4
MASNNRSACSCILHHDFRTRHGKGCFGCEQSDAGEANKCYGGARRCNVIPDAGASHQGMYS